jgi:tRNA pseudouridine(55) synthase
MKLLNKPIGVTSNEFIHNLKEKGILNKKSCYCGRLDPMARGKMLILEGDECKKMPDYLGKDKVYEFELVFGFSTDTDDYLGLINKINLDNNTIDNIIKNKLQNKINFLIKSNTQKFHSYSSYVLRKNGVRRPLWEWKKMGLLEENDIPIKNIKIYNLDIIDRKYYSKKYFLSILTNNIAKINKRHKFRQKIIKDQWNSIYNDSNNFIIESLKIKMHVTSGFYIRQFVNDLKNLIDFPIMVYDINRIDI